MPEENEPKGSTGLAERIGAAIAALLLVCIPIISLWAVIEIFPSEVPTTTDPGYVDVVFQDRFVVFAARLVVLSAALVLLLAAMYIAASMIVRIKRGQWLRRAGPFESELAEAEADLRKEVNSLLDTLAGAWEAHELLETRLEQRDREVAQLTTELEDLSQEIVRLQAARGA